MFKYLQTSFLVVCKKISGNYVLFWSGRTRYVAKKSYHVANFLFLFSRLKWSGHCIQSQQHYKISEVLHHVSKVNWIKHKLKFTFIIRCDLKQIMQNYTIIIHVISLALRGSVLSLTRDPHEIIYHPKWELNHYGVGCSHDAGWMILKVSCCL